MSALYFFILNEDCKNITLCSSRTLFISLNFLFILKNVNPNAAMALAINKIGCDLSVLPKPSNITLVLAPAAAKPTTSREASAAAAPVIRKPDTKRIRTAIIALPPTISITFKTALQFRTISSKIFTPPFNAPSFCLPILLSN